MYLRKGLKDTAMDIIARRTMTMLLLLLLFDCIVIMVDYRDLLGQDELQ